jgi:DNA-binding MarR family transcriptional regulator
MSLLAARGSVRMGELAAHCHLDRASLTMLVARMGRHGLITRYVQATDRRGVLVMMTDHGFGIHRSSQRDSHRRIAARLQRLSEPDLRRLADAVPALTKLADASEEGTATNGRW